MSRIGHMIYGNYQFGGYDHADFGKANDAIFMGELHEALSHLQPYEGPLEQEMEFEVDLSRALEDEYAHERVVSQIEREAELAHAEAYHMQPFAAELYQGEIGDPGSVTHTYEEEPSWRDDHDHFHSGFDLSAQTKQDKERANGTGSTGYYY